MAKHPTTPKAPAPAVAPQTPDTQIPTPVSAPSDASSSPAGPELAIDPAGVPEETMSPAPAADASPPPPSTNDATDAGPPSSSANDETSAALAPTLPAPIPQIGPGSLTRSIAYLLRYANWSPEELDARTHEEIIAAADEVEKADHERMRERFARTLESLPMKRTGWPRDVAFALKVVRVYLGGSLTSVLGGEFIDDRERVEQLRSDPAFKLIPVESPDHLEFIKQDYADARAELQERAKAMGLVIYRDGEVTPPRGQKK